VIAVIFEAVPAPGQKEAYLDAAAKLRPLLAGIDGFISIERFESISNPGHFVSLSFWRDEEAVRKWRNLQQHREAQAKGRGGIFSAYRLRVAQVLRDYSMDSRKEAPEDSVRIHG